MQPLSKELCYRRIINLLEKIAIKHGLRTTKDDGIHDAFIVWFAERINSIDPIEATKSIAEDRRGEGIDAILPDRRKKRIFFIQARTAKTFKNVNKSFGDPDIKSSLGGVKAVLDNKFKGEFTPVLEKLADQAHNLITNSGFDAEVCFLTFKKKPRRSIYIEQFQEEYPVKVTFIDFEWVYNFYSQQLLTMRPKPPATATFNLIGKTMTKDKPQKSIVFSCEAKDLAKIYESHDDKIFQEDVRYSLGFGERSINKQIQLTAESEKDAKHFWYFNNGVTLVCKSFKLRGTRNKLDVKSPQIINGAQTTYALYEAFKTQKLRQDAVVLIKAIQSNDDDFIRNVTQNTNSQNVVGPRDLSSNDSIQDELQTILADSYRYFYERKRGEFKSFYQTPAKRRQEWGKDYRKKIINNEKAAQAFLAMYKDRPAQAKSGKRRIFIKDRTGYYNDIFDSREKLLAEKLLLSWKVLSYLEQRKIEYRKICSDPPKSAQVSGLFLTSNPHRIAPGISSPERCAELPRCSL